MKMEIDKIDKIEETKKEIKDRIDSLNLKDIKVDSIDAVAYTFPGDKFYYIANISGGFNGRGNWMIYLHQIEEIISHFVGGYIISIKNDSADDVWNLKLGIIGL